MQASAQYLLSQSSLSEKNDTITLSFYFFLSSASALRLLIFNVQFIVVQSFCFLLHLVSLVSLYLLCHGS